jgi:3',5'-nucleoside bisphosphate phosphatase
MLLNTDFHIHTALSPCGDEDMTPNNIVNMAMLNGLDAIAITDHNTVENVAACMKVGQQVGVTVIPGMELQTREEVHVICLFPELEKALSFQKLVYDSLPPLSNNERVFGEQLIMDEQDHILGKNSRLLLTSTSISFDEAFEEVKKLGGVFIPAHIDKSANSVIENLGFIPDYLAIKNIEYKSIEKINLFLKAGFIKASYRLIKSSDAHYLQDIQQDENKLECGDNSAAAIIDKLNS